MLKEELLAVRPLHLLLVLPLIGSACTKTINLKINNPTDLPYEISVIVTPGDGKATTSKLGRLGPKKPLPSVSFALKPSTDIKVIASVPSSAAVFESSRTILDSDKKSFDFPVEIAPIGRTTIAESPIDTIRARLKNLGPGLGLPVLNINNALKTILGGIVVATFKDNEPAQIHLTLTSVQIGNETALGDFPWQANHETIEEERSNSTVAALTGNFAIYGGFSLDTTVKGYYKFRSVLKDFGPVQLPEKAGWDLNAVISDSQKHQLLSALRSHPGSKLYYINRVWVAREASTELYKSTVLGMNAKSSVMSILTADAAFQINDTVADSKSYSGETLEFMGEDREVTVKPAQGSPALTMDRFLSDPQAATKEKIYRLVIGKARSSNVSIPAQVVRAFTRQ